jgi:hypothetical protein
MEAEGVEGGFPPHLQVTDDGFHDLRVQVKLRGSFPDGQHTKARLPSAATLLLALLAQL